MSSFVALPWELIVVISARAGVEGVHALALCCQKFAPLARDAYLWKCICLRTLSQAALDRIAASPRISWRWECLARRSLTCECASLKSVHARPTDSKMSSTARTGQWIEPTRGGGLDIVRGTIDEHGIVRRDSRAPLHKGIADVETPARIHTYSNGDSVAFYVCPDNGPEICWFRCSPHCPDARFAGRIFFGPWKKPLHEQYVPPRGFCPAVKSRSETAAFHAYVAAGLIGWNAAAGSSYERLAAEQHATDRFSADVPMSRIAASATNDPDSRRTWVPPADDPSARYCPLSKRPIENTEDWAILSSGLLADAIQLSDWFDANRQFGFPPTDPTTGEPIMCAAFAGRNWPDWLPIELARGAVVRACHRLSVLIADGADLLARDQSEAVLALVIVDIVGAHVCAKTPSARDSVPDADVAIGVDGHVVHYVTRSTPLDPQSGSQPMRTLDASAPTQGAREPEPAPADIGVTCVRYERVTWTDHVFKGDFFAATPLIACRFVRCRFSACVFVDAIVCDCVFDQCTFDNGLCRQGRGRPPLPDVIDDSVASILVRLGCFRVCGIVQL
ncbi:Pentapeptide 4 incomplete domain containing protein [Pandoravirus salinus]|uniref:Pentapeptide 4 incomplete domain containing protein n=1 Tax=Pandoravirus salinus TaxID=1349410 RepID=S4W1I4_9VIRU|nr:Pentapeptide 4 superfamily incomplete domain [Pandoravirus salinus]AGO85666.1 Pentapeptide 4 incomplete domain containing protein [Pandoravirus salinus]